MKKMLLAVVLLAGTGLALAQGKHAHGKHVHGEAEMNILLDGNDLLIEFRSPLANFLPFERAPENDKEAAAVREMTAILRDAGKVFQPTAAAACTAGEVSLMSAELPPELLGMEAAPGVQKKPQKHDAHGNLVAVYSFNCASPEKVKSIKVNLFSYFKGFSEVDVQLVVPGRQLAAHLTPRQPLLSW